jgi:outer membrane protein OmpA-like peptidoglycan-associated protein
VKRFIRLCLTVFAIGMSSAPAVACDLGPEKIHFASGSYSLPASSGPILDIVAAWIDVYDKAGRIWLRSHTDRVGDGRANLKLSRRRAEAVRDQLVRRGVPASRIDIMSRGEAMVPFPTPDEAPEPRNNFVQMEIVTAEEAATWRSNGKCG